MAEHWTDALAASGTDGAARARALAVLRARPRAPVAAVQYRSEGWVLVIGPEASGRAAVESLGEGVRCTVLAVEGGAAQSGAASTGGGLEIVRRRPTAVSGHLGAFTVTVADADGEVDLAATLAGRPAHFDVVLDLRREPAFRQDLPPPGYYAPGRDEAAFAAAIEAIPGLTGEFEKPQYFRYDPDICAHGRSGLAGCSRCLEACPTDAIRSLGELVEVDPYLCQGGGGCATVCPTGAMTYAYPPVSDLLEGLRGALRAHREAGGSAPCVLFHDGEAGAAALARVAASLPARVLPVELEEIASVGMDAWLTLLAYGAGNVALLRTPATAPTLVAALERELACARAALAGLGLGGGAPLVLIDAGDDRALVAALEALEPVAALAPAGFAAPDEKRSTLRLALDHLFEQAPAPEPYAPMPAGAPFGQVRVDRAACTLCLACVAVCPAKALHAGGERPQLDFLEWNCVQCGMCETACPEDAITRAPRLILDPRQRGERVTLNAEEPFACVVCGKPFATRSVIERMRAKLQNHWMFQQPQALKRLEMCEDCRVKDMFKDGGGVLDMPERH